MICPTDQRHLQVLRILETQPDLSQRQLAKTLGVSVGKINYCIHALVERGLLKVKNFRNSQDKLAYTYLLTPAGIAIKAELTARFLKQRLIEYELLKQEIDELRQETQTRPS